MKKTLIAASIAAVVAAPAFADVKISGQVEQIFKDTDNTSTGIAGDWDNDISFVASEDLGNGLTAFAKLSIDMDKQEAAASSATTKDQYVGIKGNFGTVMVGRFEAFVEGKVASRMTFDGHDKIEDSTQNVGRNSHGVAYVSPTVNGFHIGVGGYATDSESENFDATEIAVFYDNGPISLAYAQQDLNATLATGLTGDANRTTRVATGSYTMGDAKATILWEDNEDFNNSATGDSTDISYRLDYKMGNNAITVGFRDDEVSTSGASGEDVWSIELDHNFSKQTKAYIGTVNYDKTTADFHYVGLLHKF